MQYRVFDVWDVDSRTATSIKTIDWRSDNPAIATKGRDHHDGIVGAPAQPLTPGTFEKYLEIARRAVVLNSGVLVQLVPVADPEPPAG